MIKIGLIPAFALLSLILITELSGQSEEPTVIIELPPSIHGRVEGTVRMMSPGNLNFNSNAEIVGDVLVPGIPNVKVKKNATFLGVVEGGGDPQPSNYKIQINGSASVEYIYNRIDGGSIPSVADPPSPSGALSVNINQSGEDPGDFTDINNLTLNGNVGVFEIPPGTYGNFTANSGSGFRLGVVNSTDATVYNFQRFNLNGSSSVEVVGPVIVNLKNGSSFNSDIIGNLVHPEWLLLNVANGGINLNNGVLLYGHLYVPDGNVGINSNAVLTGSLTSKGLNLNGGGLINGIPLDTNPPQNLAPMASPDNLSLDEDSSVAFTLVGSDPEGLPITFAVTELPAAGALTGTAPNLTFTPDPNGFGPDQMTFVVNDGVQDSSPAVVSFTINPVNDPPVAQSQSLSTLEDVALQLTLTGVDIENDLLSYSISVTPSNGQLTGTAPDLTYVPNADFAGSDTFSFVVNDGILDSAPADISIAISPVNDTPGAVPLNLTLDEDTSIIITLLGDDLEGDVLNFSLVTLPSNGVLELNGSAVSVAPATVLETDILEYFPARDFDGSDSFVYEATDGLLNSDEATVTLNVNPVNDVPVLVTDNFTTSEDIGLDERLVATDVDGDLLSYSLKTDGVLGTVSLNPDGSFNYLPISDVNGLDSFVVDILDAVGISSHTIFVQLDPVNDAPIALPLSVITNEEVPVGVTLQGSDVDGHPLLFQVTNPPGDGTLSGIPPNMTYSPDLNFFGTDSFSYQVSDGVLNSMSEVVSLTVNPVNDAPVGEDLSFQSNEDESLLIVFTPTDADEDVLSIEIVSLPSFGSLEDSLGDPLGIGDLVTGTFMITYAPDANFNGGDSFTFLVNDGALDSLSAVVSITIDAVNDDPVPISSDPTVDEDVVLAGNLIATDADGDSLTFSLNAAPVNGLVIVNPDGSYSYSPNANFNGADSFSFFVSDGSVSILGSEDIIITAVDDPPIIGANLFSLNEDGSLVGQAFEVTEVDGETLTFTLVSSPAQGTFTFNGDNFDYQPSPDFNGNDSFVVEVTDGNSPTISFTISMDVQAVPDDPIANGQNLTVANDTPLPITLTGSDPDGEPLSFAISSAVSQGVLQGTPPNVTYVPSPVFVGTDSFQFTVTAGARVSAPAAVSIDITQANAEPEITSVPDTNIYFQVEQPSVGPENRLLEAEVTVRDFSDAHPDFQNFFSGLVQGLVAPTLDTEGKPVFVGTPNQGAINSQTTFAQWYRDVPGVNLKTTKSLTLEETEPGSGIFAYENLEFFLIDDELLGNEGRNHNFHYTMEWHGLFTYRGGETFEFLGDDDIYLFINGNLVVDIGGVHTEEAGMVDLDTLGLTIGDVYPFDLFYAERFTDESHLTFQTSIEIKSDGNYVYQVIANDINGDDLTYTLIDGPAGMEIDASGLVTWIADLNDIGSYPVEIEVADTFGATDTQTFTLVVERNFSPSVDAGADSFVRSIADDLALNGQVIDDGNPVEFSLTHEWTAESGPSVATIAEETLQVTTASASDPGIYVFSLVGDDGELSEDDLTEIYLQPAFEAPAPNNLVAWWSGNLSPLDDTGDFHGLYALERKYNDAVAGSGFDFIDSRGYLEVDVTGDLDLTSHSGFSFEFWVRPKISPADFGYIAQFGSPQDQGIGIFFERSLSQQLSLELPLAAGGVVWADAFPFFEFGSEAWVHVVITYDSISGLVVFYKDGIIVKEVNVGTLALKSQDTFYIPQFRPDDNQGFDGQLDEFSIFSRALEHQEVLDLYRNDIFGKPPLGGNTPPVIDPLSDLTFTSVPPGQTFSVSVTDDNLPFDSPPNVSWEVLTGDTLPVLSTTVGSSVDVTFTEEGTYTFIVTATDGAFTATESFNVQIVSPASAVFVNDIVAWWDGNSTTIDRVNGLEALALADESYVDGQVGGAFLFDGLDDRFHVKESSILDLGAGDGFSVEFWFKNTGSEKGRIVEWWKNEVQGVTIDKNAPFDDALLIEVWDTSGVKHGFAELGYFVDNQWEHIAITYDKVAGVLTFYRNGGVVREWTGRFFEPRTTGDFFIGGRPIFFPTDSPNGSLDELSLYSRALTSSEVQSIFNAGSLGKVPAPINQAPVAAAGGDQSIALNDGATLNGSATDDGLPAGNSLTYLWEQISGPGASVIANSTSATTSVSFPVDGIYEFQLTISDGELAGSDSLTVTVTPPVNRPPVVNAGVDVTSFVEDTLLLSTDVTDDGLPSGTLTFFWSVEAGAPGSVSFVSSGNDFIASFSDPGNYTLTLSGDDGEFVSTDSKDVTVLPGTGLAILSPADGDEVTAPTDVVARVQSSGLNSYTLQFRSILDPYNLAWIDLANGSATVEDAVIANLDPTLLLNGPYEMRLLADTDSGPLETDTVSFFVDGSMKIGNFALAFQDMTIPGIGIPIEIIRSYDSRDTRLGDFGVGWQLAIQNLDLRKNRALDTGWFQTLPNSDPGIQSFYVDPVKEKYVTIRLPDDSLQRFRLGMVVKNRVGDPDNCSFAVPVTSSSGTFEAHYYPVGDTQGTLVSVGLDDLPDNQVYVQGTGTTELTYDFIGFEPYNPTRFKYTSNEGTEFIIDEVGGLLSVTDRNRNSLTITSGGLIHSSGRSVIFTRNTEGLIESITDPEGNALTYTYDTLDRLIRVTDRETNGTEFFYEDLNFPFYLTKVLDPRGIDAIRTEFDAEGRMIKQLDADGNEIEFTHDIANFSETVENRLGDITTYEYDDNGNVVRMVDPQLHETTYTYDDNDNELTVTDHLGNTTTRTYDSRNNLLTEEDGLGNVTTFTYDDFSNPLTITNARLKTTSFTYDAGGNLETQLDAENNLTTYGYDGLGNLTSITDSLNQTTEFVYDGLGNQRRVTVKDNLNNVLRDTSFTYDDNGNQITMSQLRTTPTGPVTDLTAFEYDTENRLVKTIFPDGSYTSVVYNTFGKQASTLDELDRETVYEYDDRGNLIKTTFPDLTFEEMTYDLEGRRSSTTDRRGFTTVFFYDELGRLTDTVHPDGTPADPNDNPVTSSIYDEIGRVTNSIDELGNITQFEYDPNCGCAGRRTKVIDPLLNETTFTYDDNGNQEMVTDALLRTTNFIYDDNDRPVAVLFDDNSTTVTEYDALGRRVAEIDQEGNKTAFFYDALGRLIQVDKLETDGSTPPNFTVLTSTFYGYDESGNLVSQIDAENRETTYEYDNRGRRTKRTLPGGEFDTMTYNLSGTLASTTDMNGYTTSYTYDDMDRLVEVLADATHPSLTLSHAPAKITYAYNNAGQPIQGVVYNAVAHGETILHALSMIYDERGQLIEKAADGGTLTYTYDSARNLKSSKSSNLEGLDVAFDYDVLNRLKSVGDLAFTPPETHGYTYDDVGNLATVAYANGVTHTYTYNTLNRLTNLAVTDTASQILQSHTYTLNAVGHRTNAVEANGRVVDYEYDNLYRLTREVLGGTLPSLQDAIDYTYDDVGNRLTRTSVAATLADQVFGYDNNDRIETDTYDSNGNTLTSTNGGEGVTDTYNFMNKLIRRVTAGGTVIDVIYDANGTRIRKSVTPPASATVTTNYLVDENNHTGFVQVLEEQDNSFQVLKSYTYGHDLISVDQLVGASWELSYYLYDGHGNVRGLTDGLGVLTDTYIYDAFGNLIDSSGTTSNAYLYTGEQFDFDLGMYFLRARYYNPDNGRFHTMDTFEGFQREPLSLHKYLYANANPVMGLDPSGNFSLPEINYVNLILNFLLPTLNLSTLIGRGAFAASLSTYDLVLANNVYSSTVNALEYFVSDPFRVLGLDDRIAGQYFLKLAQEKSDALIRGAGIRLYTIHLGFIGSAAFAAAADALGGDWRKTVPGVGTYVEITEAYQFLENLQGWVGVASSLSGNSEPIKIPNEQELISQYILLSIRPGNWVYSYYDSIISDNVPSS